MVADPTLISSLAGSAFVFGGTILGFVGRRQSNRQKAQAAAAELEAAREKARAERLASDQEALIRNERVTADRARVEADRVLRRNEQLEAENDTLNAANDQLHAELRTVCADRDVYRREAEQASRALDVAREQTVLSAEAHLRPVDPKPDEGA
jgi:hypothetical protein